MVIATSASPNSTTALSSQWLAYPRARIPPVQINADAEVSYTQRHLELRLRIIQVTVWRPSSGGMDTPSTRIQMTIDQRCQQRRHRR